MFVAEVGLNHNGDIEYAREYLNFFKNSKIDGLTFQIREPVFYTNVKKSHLKLPKSFYNSLCDEFKEIEKKSVGLTIECSENLEDLKYENFDFFKILSTGAKDKILIEKLLTNTNSTIYISCGLLDKNEIISLINKYSYTKKIKFIYTVLSYEVKNINLANFFHLAKLYEGKISYGHHYPNELPLLLLSINKNIDQFIYLKGNKSIHHPDENHALNFGQFGDLLIKINELNKIIGHKDVYFAKNDIPDQ